eukprot:Blabericola_migrator_1__8802@NODE_4644_length_1045_cov_6_632924_g1875_i3_p1_GENE_NODE_4644_length_1045_cov_6_632924_g1875_i3NODE_4644_length_1045_cov_6_632924_g1875_i3_p1_ORF_typecomplete_len231_score43_96W2/PF02020_18/1_2W2/PF02020_18/11_NODE_4644_length_1045_cov_6_632924_g1875_i369761
MDQEFFGAEDFQARLFGLIRTAMRSYAFVPKLSNRFEDSKAWYPHDFNTPLGDLLHTSIKGLQKWCADAHKALKRTLHAAINEAYESDTVESSDFINSVKDVEPTYTRNVQWLMDQIDLSSVEAMPPPPEPSQKLHPQVAKLLKSLYTFDWLMQKMPWDCFLFFRANLATLVREIDGGKQGFSFLANILESLSFTERDIDEFKRYYAEASPASHAYVRAQFFRRSVIQPM